MKNKAYLALFVSIISVSFAAIIIVLCESHEDHPLTIAFYRLLFTTLILLPFVFIHKKTRKEIFGLPASTYLMMVIIGIILALHFSFWITSLSKTSVASSVILVTAHPLLVGPVSHFFLKERLSKINAIGLVTSVTGVLILVYGNYGFSSGSIDTLEGNLLAILGGVAAGLYIMGGRKLRKTVSVGSYAFIVYGIATVVLFIICLSFGEPVYGLSTNDYILLVIMAIVAGIFGHTLYNWSLEHIRASIASVSLLGEPIGSSFLALIIPQIGQVPSEYTALGGTIIILGIYLTSRKNRQIIF